jgi:PPOX class probable F420-dependent enzyme
MAGMTQAEIDAFLAQSYVARIATVRPDGRPHVVPIWFWWDGVSAYMETPPNSVKANNLRHNPHCALTVDITEGGLRFAGVIMEGTVELLTDRQVQLAMAARVYTKYLGEEGAKSPTPQRMIHNEHVIIKFTPDRTVTWDDRRGGLAPIP